MGQLGPLPEVTEAREPPAAPRAPEDDFYCLRYGVWYPSVDCAFRTLYRTCAGCADCEQGRFNLKRHRATLERGRSSRVHPRA